jgi:hypothetical protein
LARREAKVEGGAKYFWIPVLGLLAWPFAGLFEALVLKCLWNWFATEALHLPKISFWAMYGFILVFGVLTAKGTGREQERKFRALTTSMEACVPESKKEWVRKQLDEQKKPRWNDFGEVLSVRVLGPAFMLGIGWAVHRFLL